MKKFTTTSEQGQPVQGMFSEGSLSLSAIFGVLWRGKLWIVLALLIFSFLGGYYAFRGTVPKFGATAILVFSPEESNFLNLESIVAGGSTDRSSLNTEIAIITARETVQQLVERLNLVEEPEFNPALVANPNAFSLKETIKSFFGLTSEAPERTEAERQALTLRTTTSNVARALSVGIERDTYLLKITAVSTDPVLAARMANTLAEIYIEGRRTKALSATENAVNWLQMRVRDLEGELRDKEQRISDLLSQTDLINQEALELLGVQAKELRDRLTGREEDLRMAQIRFAELQAASSTRDAEQIALVFDDLTLRRLMQNTQTAGDGLSAAFEARVDAVLSAQQSEIDRARREVDVLSDARDKLQAEITEQTSDLQELEQMERELEVVRDLYQTLLTGLQEVTVQAGLVQDDTSLISRALPPLSHFSPNATLIVIVAGIFGALLASGWLLLTEATQTVIRSTSDLERLSGLKVLGQLPRMPVRQRNKLIGYLRDNPTAPAVEAIRNLRTSLLLSSLDRPPQTIMVTSSVPGEGKTTLSVALAMNLAGLGKRVLLVEGDLRRCTLQQYYPDQELEKASSLPRVLDGSITLAEAVVPDFADGIDVLLGERTAVNAADLLSSKAFLDFLQNARAQYDHIIIDTPPVLAVPDARIVAPLVDTMLMNVRWDSTKNAQVLESLRQFEASGHQAPGLVLTLVDRRKQRRYGGAASYDTYGYGKNSYG